MNTYFKTTLQMLLIGLLAACTVSQTIPTAINTSPAPPATDLVDDETRTLSSLKQVDEYPLYTMTYYGEYPSPRVSFLAPGKKGASPPFACSLFTVLLDEDHLLYGRNFDWDFSPALLMFTNPPGGYASVSMIDMEFLGFGGQDVFQLADLSMEERRKLLDAPQLPLDGMNEHGLAIAVAAVPPGGMQADPSKEIIGSLGILRQVLDHARTVDEAVAIMRKYNIDFTGGPPLHYLIADATGKAVLVEFYRGEMKVLPNEQPWHSATNFLLSSVQDPAEGNCWRYDRINERLDQTRGALDAASAMQLLSEVTQDTTQWSVVYQMGRREVSVVMGRDYENVHTFQQPEAWKGDK